MVKKNNFTQKQMETLQTLLRVIRNAAPDVEVVDYRDLSPDLNRDGKITPNEWIKQCPLFEVKDVAF
jgi:N-acetyl-anhydromuramyl-L-alanine amidase AmpD